MFAKFIAIITYLFAYVGLNSFVFVLVYRETHNELIAFLFGLLAALILIFYFHRFVRHEQLFSIRKLNLSNVLWTIAVGFSLTIVSNLMLSQLAVGTLSNQVAIEGMIVNQSQPIVFLTIVIIGPMIEELLFRHLFLGIVFRYRYQWIGALLSSVFFAIAHSATTVPTLLIYGVPGLILSYIYIKKGLENAMLWHMMLNGIALMATWYL